MVRLVRRTCVMVTCSHKLACPGDAFKSARHHFRFGLHTAGYKIMQLPSYANEGHEFGSRISHPVRRGITCLLVDTFFPAKRRSLSICNSHSWNEDEGSNKAQLHLQQGRGGGRRAGGGNRHWCTLTTTLSRIEELDEGRTCEC